MAVTAELKTSYGELRSLYVRINSVETSNHGVESHVLFRGFVTEDGFKDGSSFMWESEMAMTLDILKPIWPQAYEYLKKLPEFHEATDC